MEENQKGADMPNYWIFQANPRTRFIVHYYLKDYLVHHPDFLDWWKVNKLKIHRGDIAFIWKAAGEPKREDAPEYFQWLESLSTRMEKPPAGIYALAEVIGEPKKRIGKIDEQWHKYFVKSSWGQSSEEKFRVDYKYKRLDLVDNPLPETKLWEKRLDDRSWCTPGLEKLRKRMKYTEKGVYKVEEAEGKLIERIINEHLAELRPPIGEGARPPVKETAAESSMLVKHPVKSAEKVGQEVINFRGIIYEPTNENGVQDVFNAAKEDLGFKIESRPTQFPDMIAIRKTEKGSFRVKIEFEYLSSHYQQHRHPVDEHNLIIVCWIHDWTNCPSNLEVIELKSRIKTLKP
jgi:hypothetical protein